MSTSRERFSIPNNRVIDIQLHTGNEFIPVQNMFFAATRNTVRGLEEWIVHYNHEDEHDYRYGEYMYELTVYDGGKLFVWFRNTDAMFGSSIEPSTRA